MNEDTYSLPELLTMLEKIKEEGEGSLNFPKAFYCLAKEVAFLRIQLAVINGNPHGSDH